MEGFSRNKERLCDRVLFALELAIQQEDLEAAETLSKAMDIAMTRDAGGSDFIERRIYPDEIEKAIENLRQLKKKAG